MTRANSSLHGLVVFHEPARGPQGEVEGFVREPRHFGLVGNLESGIDVCFERKLTEQTKTEGVDGRDLDVADVIAQITPAGGRERALVGPPAQQCQHAIAHLRGGLARERHGEDVAGIDARFDEPDVSVHQHTGFPGARRRLEDDVIGRIDGEVTRRLIRRGLCHGQRIKQARLLHRCRARIPCGTRARTGTTGTPLA